VSRLMEFRKTEIDDKGRPFGREVLRELAVLHLVRSRIFRIVDKVPVACSKVEVGGRDFVDGFKLRKLFVLVS
jgi:hypothetical protein